MALLDRFNTSLTDIPDALVHSVIRAKKAIDTNHRCVSCGNTYSGADIGVLSCHYHPFEHINSCARVVPYCGDHPSPCSDCNRAHLTPGARLAVGEMPGSRPYYRTGCTPIDCCADGVRAVLAKPYRVVPLKMAQEFSLYDQYDDWNSFGRGAKNNVILIDRPEMMQMTLQIEIPGTRRTLLVPVVEMYEELAQELGLGDLRQTVRKVRRGPNASSITRIKGMQHADALDTYRLYTDDTEAAAEFTPFFVVARVWQNYPLELLDIPEMVTVLADDELI